MVGSGRYEVLQDPFNSYIVYDVLTDAPAEIEGYVLIGLDKEDAMLLCMTLNSDARPSKVYLQSIGLSSR